MNKDTAGAYLEEQAYLKDRMNAIDTSLMDRLKPYGYDYLDDYFTDRKEYIIEYLKPQVVTATDIDTQSIVAMITRYSLSNKALLLFPELSGLVAYVGEKKEIYTDKATELGVKIIYMQLGGGTMIESPEDFRFSLALPLSTLQIYDLSWFNNKLLTVLNKYDDSIVIDNNDFMKDGIKIGGASFNSVDGTQLYVVNITFGDVTDVAAQIIPQRSIKQIGHLTGNYKESLKHDVIELFHGVE